MRGKALKVLIIGGYGTFGGRIVQLLSDEPRLTLLVSGRSLHKAEAFVRKHDNQAKLVPVQFDRDGDVATQIQQLSPDIVVDASGPFQFYGSDPYGLVEVCIASGVNYLDLADGSDFVRGIAEFNSAASDREVFVLSGVSSCPVLTSAVCSYLVRNMTRVDAICGGIAPSPYSSVGQSVIEAIASYAGKPVAICRGGEIARARPFTETKKYTVAPPGTLPLLPMTFSLVDVPDLTLLAQQQPMPANVWFGAAPVPAIYHAMFRLLARGVRLGALRSLNAISSLMYFVMNHLSWGEHRGGMFVEVSGTDNEGQAVRRSWHLVAEGNDGPMIPAMAAEIVIRRCIEGDLHKAGARPAHGELQLKDFEPMLGRLNIQTGLRQSPLPDEWPLFRSVLGDAWPALPVEIQRTHESLLATRFSGRAAVTRGRSIFARLAGWMIGFPLDGARVPVTVTIRPDQAGEKWSRDFDGHSFSSKLSLGTGRFSNLLCEQFGPFRFGMGLVLKGDELHYVPRQWSFLGIPMPISLAPGGAMYESVKDGRFQFHVEITLPIIGNVVTYSGWLDICVQPSSAS